MQKKLGITFKNDNANMVYISFGKPGPRFEPFSQKINNQI